MLAMYIEVGPTLRVHRPIRWLRRLWHVGVENTMISLIMTY